MKRFLALLLIASLLAAGASSARKPLSAKEHAEIQTRIDNVRQALKVPNEPAAQRKILEKALAKEDIHEARRGLVPLVTQLAATEQEPFLIGILSKKTQRDVWDLSVTRLNTQGTPKAIRELLRCSTAVPEKDLRWPTARSVILAHREAIFALAEIGQRHPAARKEIVEALSALKASEPVMSDPRRQALYLLTKDRSYLKPFFKRLKSSDPEVRRDGVVAFRFLKLTVPPVEIVRALEDPNVRVRSWSALVLGEIGDPDSVEVLLRSAENEKEERSVRANAIAAIGRIGPAAREAVPHLKKFIPNEDLNVNAAIALSRITGVRHRLVPEGYSIDQK